MINKVIVLNQWAVVTGASKGLGYYYCQALLAQGYHVLGLSRDSKKILELADKYPHLQVKNYDLDLSDLKNIYKLFELSKELNVTVVINNAGYGVWGTFADSMLEQELNMINLNISCLHILTKLFVQRFSKNNYGRVINIGSMAAFSPGPVFASYYASKSYVWSLGVAVNYELKRAKSKVRVITICPGPLKTEFWNRSSNGKGNKEHYSSLLPVLDTETYAKKSLQTALKTKRKSVIITGISNKITRTIIRILPLKTVLKLVYNYQKNR
ncbi:SDR family NAD(P)-dependent oxidoreductase [Spiroplasma endosymbiont of Nomada rufipes]|uniref:SDR family NAD(P)-dependent oxidoreductase n=1 Tax=Spiroplasma endosymbiont of Nomada rufipes TaxID=3077933 RepID=UPI00376ED9E6